MILKRHLSAVRRFTSIFLQSDALEFRREVYRRAFLLCQILTTSFTLTACNVFTFDFAARSNTATNCASADDRLLFNERVEKKEYAGSKYKKTFVGVAIAGGGSRAANFTLATLWELEQAGLLPPETVISSVSGGSLTAAYYALHRNDEDWTLQNPNIKKHFRSDLQSKWVGGWLLPQNIFYYWLTPYDRSDIMKDVLDHFLRGPQIPPDGNNIVIPLSLRRGFEHRIPFSEIPPNGPNRNSGLSRLFLNATMLDGRSFVFTNEVFHDLGSSLSDYPLADAVMASGAFPGGFNCVTLQQYDGPFKSKTPKSRQKILPFRYAPDDNVENIPENLPHHPYDDPKYRKEGKETKNAYVHLMDGGASDNLGVRTLLRTIHERKNSEQYDQCVLFLIDSYQDPLDIKWSRQARALATFNKDPRLFADYLVDSNAMTTFDTLLTNNRENVIRALNYPRKDVGDLPLWDTQEIEIAGGLNCKIWHISFQRLSYLANDKTNDMNQTERKRLKCISRIANETVTAYRLDSPGIHDTELLQQNLFNAAHKLIAQDKTPAPEIGSRCTKEGAPCFVKDILADQYEKWGIEVKPDILSRAYPLSNICENIEKY